MCLTPTFIFNFNQGDQIETSIKEDIWNILRLNMEEGKLYILQNVSVTRNGAEFRLANHEYKLEVTRFSVVISMLSESLSQLSCLKPILFETFIVLKFLHIAQVWQLYFRLWSICYAQIFLFNLFYVFFEFLKTNFTTGILLSVFFVMNISKLSQTQ